MPRRSSSSSSRTLPRRDRPVKTAALSLSREAGRPNVFEAEWRTWTGSAALTVTTGFGGECEPGLVIEEVEDLDRRVVGELPRRGVQLPGLVGEGGFESDEGRLRTLVGLRGDQPVAFEYPPD